MNKKIVIGIIIAGIFVMLAFVPVVEYNAGMHINAGNYENSEVSALPLKGSNNVYKFIFHGNKVLVKKERKGYFASYNINGKITNISVVYLGNSIQYSINDGAGKYFEMPNKVIKSKVVKTMDSANPMLMPESSYNYHFWWDGLYYDGGHAHAYDHPSLSFYNLRAKDNHILRGNELCHFMEGSATVRDWNVVIGIVIGAAIGALVGSWIGVIVGAVIGAIVGLIAIYFEIMQMTSGLV
ncbi:hypothetical protein [Ferroplasma sp.]|uniref:glycine zipper family protein n=1 Tax=Ferroplasma sp. TaxID=2591003 RepID=UPI00307F3100